MQHAIPSPLSKPKASLSKRLVETVFAKLFGAPVDPAPARLSLLGVNIDNLTMEEALQSITQSVNDDARHSYAFVNADCLNKTGRNAPYARVLSRQHKVFADGSGIRTTGRMRGVNVRGNVNGTDLFPALCARAARDGHGIYLLGAREGLADLAAAQMKSQFPDLIISGTQHGYFPRGDVDKVIDSINASGAKILLVAMGAPHQELWISRYLDRLNINAAIGVGGLFDFYSGRIPRASPWMRENGLEWIWRLKQEPARMWKRYILGNPLFVWRVWREQENDAQEVRFRWRKSSLLGHNRAQRIEWGLERMAYKGLKRTLDIVLAFAGICVLTPFFLMIAAAIKFESPGPIFFSQTRVGYRGKRFRMWKFRSMFIDAEARRAALLQQSDRSGMHFKMKQDPRITRVGRIIRRASIDELPQLLNVLKGEMSIVGPRPNLETEVARYHIDEFGRLDSKPGITCIWQVSGRAEVPWERQVQMDLDYVYEPSITTDINLIVKTLPAILSGKGAY